MHRLKIGEPIYTKKIMGRSGTGLGLAVVWNTVQNHGGYVNVLSDEIGTIFELYFPITRDEVAAVEEQSSWKNYAGNCETILVIDDEELQREITCGLLIKLGYSTSSVSSGEEAIVYLQRNSIDLVVLDMIMFPGMNGRETYEKIILHSQFITKGDWNEYLCRTIVVRGHRRGLTAGFRALRPG